MTREERCDAIKFFKEVSEKEVDNARYSRLAIEALEHEPCKVSEYDKDHIWYKGCQYISLRRFLEVKKEIYEKGYAEGQRALTAWIPLKWEIEGISCDIPEELDGNWLLFTNGKCDSIERIKKDAQDHFYPDGRCFELEDAVAWMPLPESYKTESEVEDGNNNN